MNRHYARVLVAGGAAVLVTALAVPVALAAVTWTVQPGGAIETTSAPVTFKDTMTGAHFSCVGMTMGGTLKGGSGLAGRHIGRVTSLGFAGCRSPVGPEYTLFPTDLPWHLNLTSYNSTTGVARGAVNRIELRLFVAKKNGCSAVIDGTSGTVKDGVVRFSYANSTATLKMLTAGGNLHFYDVSTGCHGRFNPGDPVTLSVTFTISPAQDITGP
jgi:hypothetical protein